MSEKHRGPAFPFYRPEMRAAGGKVIRPHDENEGMTLRDYFAAKAMAAIICAPMDSQNSSDEYEQTAEWAYEYADAMLKEREK